MAARGIPDLTPREGRRACRPRRTIASHGVADLPPNRIDEEAWTLELTLLVDDKGPATVLVSEGRKGFAKVEVLAGSPDRARLAPSHTSCASTRIWGRSMEAASIDPELAWVTGGAGR